MSQTAKIPIKDTDGSQHPFNDILDAYDKYWSALYDKLGPSIERYAKEDKKSSERLTKQLNYIKEETKWFDNELNKAQELVK